MYIPGGSVLFGDAETDYYWVKKIGVGRAGYIKIK